MKTKEKIKDLQRQTKDDLGFLLLEKRDKLRQFGFDLVSGKVKNISEIRETKKDIARILTLLKI
ncbi:50S ribosomal protein L29 [Candidatus Parcubacteria bacterium]|nr:50S ribosomal protein L29 [Candidatus Parcubacteria bacterium]